MRTVVVQEVMSVTSENRQIISNDINAFPAPKIFNVFILCFLAVNKFSPNKGGYNNHGKIT